MKRNSSVPIRGISEIRDLSQMADGAEVALLLNHSGQVYDCLEP